VGSPRDERCTWTGRLSSRVDSDIGPRLNSWEKSSAPLKDIRLPHVLGWQAFNPATLGEFEEAVAHGTEAVALAETPGFVARTQSLLVLLWGLGAAYLIHGEAARAVPLLERGRTVALERDVAIARRSAMRVPCRDATRKLWP
jgi:hypothetical protein